MTNNQRFACARDDVLGDDDASALAERIAAGEFTPGQAMAAAIDRVEAADATLNALACTRFDAARREAEAADTRLSAARAFPGVPSAIKDNTDLAGLPTLHGSRAVKPRPAKADAAFARQFLATGLIPLGKTRLPEFGLTATTEFVADPPVRNPWDVTRSAGGSSGGAAALVACGALPIAHANDGGGSIRIPAACCGLVGMKVSRGRVIANDLSKGLPVDLISDGVVSRSVRDTARFFAAAERYWHNPKMPALGEVDGPGDTRLRIGVYTNLPDGEQAHPDCRAAVDAATHHCAALGHDLEVFDSPISPAMADDFMLYYGLLAGGLEYGGRWLLGPGFDKQKLDPLTRQLARHLRGNLLRLPGTLLSMRRMKKIFDDIFSRFDVVLCPTLGQPPAELGWLAPDLEFDVAWHRLRHYAGFTPLANTLGNCAISLPLHRNADGLPIGVQFAGPSGHEKTLLELAFALEQAAPWPRSTGVRTP